MPRHPGCIRAVVVPPGAGLFTELVPAATRVLFNPCLGQLPLELARHDLLLSAWHGLDASRLVDTHAHLRGTGDAGSGCSIHPSMHPWWHPAEVLRRKFILNAACVPGAGRDELGNPLLVRHALATGVTVVVAHCASLGQAADTDCRSAPPRAAFDLFARLMDEPAQAGRLVGDASAVFQSNRTPEVWRTLLQRQDWHAHHRQSFATTATIESRKVQRSRCDAIPAPSRLR